MLTLFHDGKEYPLQDTDYYIRELANGLDEVIFNLNIHDPIYAILSEEENIVDRAGQTYKVKQIDAGAKDAKVVCQLDIDAWRATLNVNYNSGTKTVAQQINAVKPAGWTVLDRSGSSIGRTIEGDLTPYDVCVECTNVYNVYIRWDTKLKRCTIYTKTMSAPVGAFATRELNLKEINYKGKSNDLVTRLYAYGKDGLSFADINGGRPYVDNNTYESRIICGIWRDDRYEVKQNLLDDAIAKVAQMSRPERCYECSIVDLQATNPELYNNLDFSLFTTATLIDDVKNVSVDYQVVERHVFPYHPEANEVIFNSEPLKITASVANITYQIENPNSTFQQIQAQRIADATDWITSGDGYVVARKDANGEWKELLFMDTNDIATAQKVLRINENGIGFSSTGYNGPYTNAWTIDGNLVADFITTGTMYLDRLEGGTLTIGGNANGNGTLQVKNASGGVIASISNTGITFNSNNFSVDTTGKLTAKSAEIEGDITVGGNGNTNGSITVKNSSGSAIASIDNAGLTYANGKFTVDNTGKITASDADITGAITAKSGTIGGDATSANRWQIGDKAIYNGVTGMSDNTHAGVYIGTDGIRFRGSTGITMDIQLGGAIVSNTSIQAHGISAVDAGGNPGSISSSGKISAGGEITTTSGKIQTNNGDIISISGNIHTNSGNVYTNSGCMQADYYKAKDGSSYYNGTTNQISWTDYGGTGHSIIVKGGIVTSLV